VSEFDAELANIFRDESVRRLDEMDAALLAIESGEPGAEAIDSLFRNAHTIKGAAGMVGFDDVRTLAHAVEDVLGSVRESGVFPPELAAPLLRATAVLRAQVTGAGEVADDDLLDDLAAALAPLSDRTAGPPGAGPADPADAGAAARTPAGPPPAGPPPAGPPPAGPPRAAPRPAGAQPAGGQRTGGQRTGPQRAGPQRGGARQAGPPPTDVPSARLPPARTSGPEADTPGQDGHEAGQEPRRPNGGRTPLRVPAEKIDHLLDVVGQLMQFRSQLGHALGGQQQLSQHAEDVLTSGERLLADLKDTSIGMRTLPLAVITSRLPRAVRDLAREAGKDVEFVVRGADTELDRVIIESLYEPLTHLLRNAVTHGIESPRDRERAGKPPRGHVELRAVPHGSLVEIVVADDGRGVSQDVIERARQEGSLADELARPGYSTAAEVTDLAGRGVGLDAVKNHVQALGGSLDIRSEPGRGLDVVMLLPLAIALMEVMFFERAGAVYGVPLVAVEEIVTVGQTLTLEGRPSGSRRAARSGRGHRRGHRRCRAACRRPAAGARDLGRRPPARRELRPGARC